MMAKLIGAITGSSVALVFAEPGCNKWFLLKRFFVGAVIGFICAPFMMDFLKLEHVFDYWLASSTACGVMAYYVLHKVFSDEILNRLLNKLGK